MGKVDPEVSEHVFSQYSLTPVVVPGIARGLFENEHEQGACNKLGYSIFFVLARVCQLVKPVKQIGKAGIDHFADAGQDDFPFFCRGRFFTWFSL